MSMDRLPKRFTGRHMLIITMCAFGIVIAVNGIIAYFAMQSWSGLIEAHPYKASQAFDQRLAKQAEDTARGWGGDLRYSGNTLSFMPADNAAALGPFETIDVALGRPTHEREDRRLTLAPRNGLFSTTVDLTAGLWNAKVVAHGRGGERYEKYFRFYVEEAK